MEARSNAPSTDNIRHIATRIVSAALWLIPIYIVVAGIVGALVGVLSGSSADTAEDAYAASEAASISFFEHYGLVVILSVVTLVVILSWYGMLPGTGKYTGVTYRER